MEEERNPCFLSMTKERTEKRVRKGKTSVIWAAPFRRQRSGNAMVMSIQYGILSILFTARKPRLTVKYNQNSGEIQSPNT